MRRRILRIALLAAIALVAGGGIVGLWIWRHYPKAPDVGKVPLKDAIAFMGTGDFNRLFERHRRQFAMAIVNRLRERSFEELVTMMMDQSDIDGRKRIADNLRKLPGHEEIGSRMFSIFLDKFYELPALSRAVYLTTFAIAQQGEMGKHPDRRLLPSPERFMKDLSNFLTRQPPHVQAQAGQFMLDLKQQRRRLGLKDPLQQ